MKKKLIILIVFISLIVTVAIFWWWQSGQKEKLPAELPEGIKYATPETGTIEGVVKPAPFDLEDVVVDPETGTKIIKDEVGILFKDDVSEEERNEIVASINGEIVGYALSGQDVDVKIKGNPSIPELKKIVEDLRENPRVINATLSRVGTIYLKRVPDPGMDPQWRDGWSEEDPDGKNWGLEAIYALSAWDYNDSIKSVRIGIVDSGFKFDHEDLNMPANASDPSPVKKEEVDEINRTIDKKECRFRFWGFKNHGTHVAGITGAVSNNSKGITGIVWNRDLYIYERNLKERSVFKGVEWLLNKGSKVINLSMAWSSECSLEQEIEDWQGYYNDELREWRKKYDDFLIIQSAGNGSVDAGREVLFNPLLDEKYKDLGEIIITVGAIENRGGGKYQVANFSNYGNLVEVLAPGKKIYSTLQNEEWWRAFLVGCFDFSSLYGCMEGTSMAAPFVTGVAGLVWGASPDLTAEQVKEILVNSADRPIAYEGREYKILNAKNSVELALRESERFVEQEKKEEIRKERDISSAIYVPNDYSTIQVAIDAASEGDTIIVRDGTYIENIDVNKAHLTIKSENGADSTIIQAANSDDHVFGVAADYVNISGFTVKGKGATGEYPYFPAGISLGDIDCTTIILPGPKCSHCTVSNNVLLNNYYGIHLVRSDNNSITNNTVLGNFDGISLYDYDEYNILTNNIVSNNSRYGIYLRANNNTLTNNNILNNGWGIFPEDSNNNIIYLNNFIGNTVYYSLRSKNIWTSPEQITYTYNGKTYTNYLGNYWSDYSENDADRDGIGDNTYNIDGDKDNYPLMKSFENYEI